jgi:agmatine deiminase
MATCPANLGYRMPAEWEPHEATWIAWPHERTDWPSKFAAIPWVYAEIVRHLSHSEPVNILVNDARAESQAKKVLAKVEAEPGSAGIPLTTDHSPLTTHHSPPGKMLSLSVRFWRIRTDRVWTRDYGPIFIKNAEDKLALVDWQFNGWAKYPNWKRDNAVPGRVAKALKLPSWEPKVGRQRVVLEGGSIDVNGQGLLLTTEECLLSPVQQRNPGIDRGELEKIFADYLGVRKVLWLGQGIAGDDTHGHVDDLARFVAPRKVVAVAETNPQDVTYRPLQENLDRLRGMTDVDGQRLEVITLPMPDPVVFRGRRLPASYANFYIANEKVLVPTFNDPKDRVALGTLADLFPEREVVGIHAVDLVWGLGTLHCLTQQQPKSE